MQLDAPKSVQPDFRIRKTRAYALLHLLTHPCFAHLEVDCNRTGGINFNGGNLFSDAGLLLFKEFLYKVGAVKFVNRMFKTNDTAYISLVFNALRL